MSIMSIKMADQSSVASLRSSPKKSHGSSGNSGNTSVVTTGTAANLLLKGPPSCEINTQIITAFEVLPDSETCKLTGLTGAEKKLLMSSWRAWIGETETDLTAFVLYFGYWLLDSVPKMRDHFSKFDGYASKEKLRHDAAFRAHFGKVVRNLNNIIKQLPRPDTVEIMVREMAINHVSKGVGSAYFENLYTQVGSVLADAFRHDLEDKTEINAAWTNLFKYFHQVCAQIEAEAGWDTARPSSPSLKGQNKKNSAKRTQRCCACILM